MITNTKYSTNETLNIIKDVENIANEVAQEFFNTERFYYNENEFTRECEFKTGNLLIYAEESNLYNEYKVVISADILISDNTYVTFSTAIVESNFRVTIQILLLKMLGIEVETKKNIVALKNKCYKEIKADNDYWEEIEMQEMI